MEASVADKMRWEYIQSLRKVAGTDIAGPVIPLYTKIQFDEFLEAGYEDYALECFEWMAEYFPDSDYTFNMGQRIVYERHISYIDSDQDDMKQPRYDGENMFYLYSDYLG